MTMHLRQWLSLLVIGGVCGLILTLTNTHTAAAIRHNQQAQALKLYADLLGELPEPSVQPATPQDLSVLDPGALSGTCATGLFAQFSTSGYAGDIVFLGLWRSGAQAPQLSMRVVKHGETPGIGDFIDHRRNSWLPDLDGYTAAQVAAVDGVSGATVTSKAVQGAFAKMSTVLEKYCDG